MLCKKTVKNQITLPKKVMENFADFEYFQVEARKDKIILIPVKLMPLKEKKLTSIRQKIADLELSEKDIEAAIAWARRK